MPREQLAGFLAGAGFENTEIVQRYPVPLDVPGNRDIMCVFEFCTKKPT